MPPYSTSLSLFLFWFPPFHSSTFTPQSHLSSRPTSSPLPFLSRRLSQVEFCKDFMPCTAELRPCQALSIQGHSTGTGTLAGAQVSGACALVSLQSRWKLNTLDCEIKGIAVIWLVRSLQNIMSLSHEEKKDEMERDYGMWDIVSCCCCMFLKERRF